MALTACARPAGVDGDLTNNWPAFPAAEVPLPAEHACYWLTSVYDPTTIGVPRQPVDCVKEHMVETVHVGRFTGAEAAAGAPPAGAALRGAYEECLPHAREFLGDDWRTGRLRLVVTPPQPAHWAAGARWYRCDLITAGAPGPIPPYIVTGSARGGLAGSRPDEIGCGDVADLTGGTAITNDVHKGVTRADCTVQHDAEFTGIATIPDGIPYPATEAGAEAVAAKACRPVNAAFLGTSDAGAMHNRVDLLGIPLGTEYGVLGERGIWCFLWFYAPGVTRSMKGGGLVGLPTQ
ncbi:hypothetical protein HC031_29205 [Planosporangium thailandense]|uniref:Septum formation-related domain-containing protein n=1 Tax=Planosporangium thailandense TaxID=765197 RepID=A0ABX0Y8N4_9ACTN|nr:hypothetical protein [Planosporangium thailandense]